MGWVQNASPQVEAASNYPTIVSVCISMTIFMTAVVSLRIYVRAFLLKLMGPDDWAIILSAVCSVIYNGLCLGQSKWGLGLPIALRPPMNLNEYSVINFAGRPFYMIGILGFKVALCLAYLRILSHGQRVYRYVVWVVLVACVLGHIGGTLVLILQCQPVQKSWIPLKPGVCLANVPTFKALAIITIAFDVIIFLLPIPVLWTLQMNRRRKTALSGVFLLGLFTTVCSVLRMARIPALAVDGNSTFLVLWGTIEMNVGILLTCVPALGPLFRYFREKSFPRPSSSRRNHFGLSEAQSADGIMTHTPITPHPDLYLNCTDSAPYSNASRSQGHDVQICIPDFDKTQKQCNHSPKTEIKDTFVKRLGIRRINSNEKIHHSVLKSVTRWSRWRYRSRPYSAPSPLRSNES